VKKLLVSAAILLFSFGASANYFKGGLGYSLGGEYEEANNVTSGDVDLDNTFMNPLVLAYGFEIMGDVSGEIELGYSALETDNNPSAEAKFISGAFNVVGAVPVGPVSLTGGAGAFFGQLDVDLAGYDTATGFGLQAFAGVDFNVTDAFSIGGEFRYRTSLSKFDVADTANGDLEAEFTNTSLLAVVKFGM